MATPHPLLSYLFSALGEPFGIYLRTTDKERLVVALNEAKRKNTDAYPALAGLTLRSAPSNPHGEIWIINTNGAPSDDEENT